jgi:hypothetical protein
VRRAALLIAVAAVMSAGAACGSGSTSPNDTPTSPTSAGGAPTASAPTTTVPATTTTTTAYKPQATRPTPDDAAYQLIAAWGDGSRAQAARIASPAAVGSLFAIPYPGSALQFRGCSSGFSPASCIYRNVNDNSIIDVYATRVAGGWYVSSVVVEQ